jgi:anti-repressor protein
MKELVKVKQQFIGESYIQSVDARELWLELHSKQEFSTWIKNRIKKYDFIEDVDFMSFDKIIKRETGSTVLKEYVLSLNTAKELAMVENNEYGKIARRYFIECEERLKQVQNEANLKYINRQIAREEAIPMLDSYDDCMVMNGKFTGKYDHANEFDMINKIVLGLTAQQYKLTHGIDLHEKSIRDYLSTLELEAICKLQSFNTMMLEEGIDCQIERRERLSKLFDRQFTERFNNELLRLQA